MYAPTLTPSIEVTIGRETRLYHAFITTAPTTLDAPATVTLHTAPLSDVSGMAADPIAFNTTRANAPARLVLVEGTELAWQRARYREADGTWTQTIIAVGRGPEGIDFSPNGREVWSAHSRDGGVSVIDVATRKVVQTIALGTKRSNRIKLTPDGKFALVSDLEAGELVVVDAAARKELKRLPLGRMPEGILIPNNSEAFVAVNGDNNVAVIDMKTWTVARRISAGTGPDGLAWVGSQP